MTYGSKQSVQILQASMKIHSEKFIEQVRKEIFNQEEEFFWEIADRETNMDYLNEK